MEVAVVMGNLRAGMNTVLICIELENTCICHERLVVRISILKTV